MEMATYFIIDLSLDGRPRLLTTEPLEDSAAHTAIERLAAAEKVLPENSRRKCAMINLAAILPKQEAQ